MIPRRQRISYRTSENGKREPVYIRSCTMCRVWFGTPFEDEPWECPVCRGRNQRREKKTWPMARKVEQR